MSIVKSILDKIPDIIDFNFITAKNKATKSFNLENNSNKDIYYKIQYKEGFKISPTEGILHKYSKQEVIIEVFPEEAEVLISNCKIILDETVSKIIKISFISKYPHIKVNKQNIDFGNLLINKSKEMDLIIKNSEKVPTKFSIIRETRTYIKSQNVFHIKTTTGEIPENCSYLLKIKYSPINPDVFSYESFLIKVHGGNEVMINCYGKCTSLNTSISSRQVNFESVELGKSTSKVIRVFNDSDVDTYFQFYYSNEGIFGFEPKQGIIKSRSNERISVFYSPRENISYYDKAFCLFKNHLLVPLDIFGSCHDLLHKPQQIESRHIDIFRYKVISGFLHANPKYSSGNNKMDISYLENINQKTMKKNVEGKLTMEIETEGTLESTNQIVLHKEMLWESTSNTRLLYSLNTDVIDFRFVDYEKRSEPYIITIINNSNDKMMLKWILDNLKGNEIIGKLAPALIKPEDLKKNKNINSKENLMKQKLEGKHSVQQFLKGGSDIIKPQNVFSVYPEEVIIPRKGSYDFKVYFNPSKPEYYFFAQLTCLGFILNSQILSNNEVGLNNNSQQNQLKSLKGLISNSAMNLINQGTSMNNSLKSNSLNNTKISEVNTTQKPQFIMDPPIPLKISVVGHSFPPSTQIYIPMAEIDPKNELNFPFSTINQSQYSSFKIKNTTDTPLFFKFLSDTSGVFRVHPKCGIIDPKQFYLICAEFCPREEKIYKFPLKIVFNHDNNNMYNLVLQGTCVEPELEINDGYKDVYFSPSFINISTRRSIKITNRSPVKVNVVVNIVEIKQIKKEKKIDDDSNVNYNKVDHNMSIGNMSRIKEEEEVKVGEGNNMNSINRYSSNVISPPSGTNLNNNVTTPYHQNKNTISTNKSKRMSVAFEKSDKDKDLNKTPNNGNYNNNPNTSDFNSPENIEETEESIEEEFLNPAQIKIEPNYFDLEGYQNRNIDLTLIPLEKCNFEIKLKIIAGRLYDPNIESLGIFNPGCFNNNKYKENQLHQNFDRREFSQIVNIIGSGADGVLKVDPLILDFGTVKVGFQEKKSFSIYNTSICNFYVQLEIKEDSEGRNLDNIFHLDFTEGLIHSLCKKTISITYNPSTRIHVDFQILIYAVEHKDSNDTNAFKNNSTLLNSMKNNNTNNEDLKVKNKTTSMSNVQVKNRIEKASINIKANGNYPFITIKDVRNNNKSTTYLWKNFNCDDANEELSKELSGEEINFINSEKANKKMQDFYEKLKCVKFNFGKHLLKKSDKSNHLNHKKFEVYLTLMNEGGVDSEFFFKFPDDISIKREIWMDPDEPTSEGTREYHVLKHKIFEIEPRRFKLKKNECCNIKFTYNIQEKNEHSLRVIFQIVNGKPLVFELYAETHYEKEGILLIKNPELDFSSIPMGNMIPMTSIIEMQNIGGIKLKYALDESVIDDYNSQFEGFPIFKVDNSDGGLGAGDIKHLIVYFKPLTTMVYNLVIPVDYYDDVNMVHKKLFIKLTGTGYHPLETVYTPEQDRENFLKDIEKLPRNIIFNSFDNKIIYKCGLSIDEINFGVVEEGKQSVQTFILFNYSSIDTLEYEIKNSGFSLKDEIKFFPDTGKLEPNSHIIIKSTLLCKTRMLTYIGEIQVKILWKKEEFRENFNSQILVERQELHLRIIKRALIKDSINAEGKIEAPLPQNTCFVENILCDFFKDIICNKTFDEHLTNTMDNQPLKLYDWTTNVPSANHSEIRKQFIENSINRVKNDFSFNSMHKNKHQKGVNFREKQDSKIDNPKKENLLLMDNDLEEKYTKDLISKFGYSNSEMEEKMLMVNEDTKKLVFDILENTVYNVICEAVYGESDLSEPTKIFFIKK